MSIEDNENINSEAPAVKAVKKLAKRASVNDIVGSAVKRRKKAKAKEQTEAAPMHWFIVQVYSGFEQKVKRNLEDQIERKGLSEFFGEIKVPQEEVTEIVRGQKKKVNKKFFPGYILVQMSMNEDTWHFIKSTPRVSGFVGDATNPLPMSEEEADNLTTQMEEGSSALSGMFKFSEGDTVKVKDGPFMDFTGTIKEVKEDKSKMVVLINIFGRATPMELDFYQVEKI